MHWTGQAGGHDAYTYQTVTGLPSGLYTARAWVRNTGITQSLPTQGASLLVKQYDATGAQLSAPIPVTSSQNNWSEWVQVQVPNIPVTNGQCTVGLYSFHPQSAWITFDDVELVRQADGALPTFTTRNSYDTSGRLLATESNDEGRSDYVYARDGRIRFSQSALQRLASRFSYSNYDEVGRVVESGEYTTAQTGTTGVEFESHTDYAAKRTGESLLLEAETARFADNNGSRPYAIATASNGYEVAFLQAVGNFVEFSAPVVADGTYELQLRYANGMGNTRTMTLFVNGTQFSRVSFAPTAGWDTFVTLRLAVPLRGGSANLIRLEYTAADNGNVNFDYLRVTPPLIQEAEEAVFADSNVGKPANSAGASGGREVAYLSSVGNYVDFSLTPPAGQNGTYELQIGYANGTGNTRTMNLRVNGGSLRQLSFLPTDTWDTFATLHTTATLQGGTTSHVRIEYTSADLGSINVDNLRAVAPINSTLKQEAESTRFTNANGNTSNAVSTASGGQDVGYLTAVGTAVPFTLTASWAGTYTLSLRYATGGADTRTMSLLVNEAPATQLALPGTSGWTQFTSFTTTVPLRAGLNTIQVRYGSNDTGYVDIDYLQADGVVKPLGHDQSVHDLVENRTRAGGLDATRCAQRNQVWYDLAFDGTVTRADGTIDPNYQNGQLNGRHQEFLVGAVAKTKNDNVTTWYSYDELGRVTWVVQDIVGVGVKTLDYQYDFSGNVLQVAYQKGQPDSFYHYYTYDAAQRLTVVSTSLDGVLKATQAEYSYYLHGPLKRVQVAGNLQGVDYTYTLQGALKNINHVNQTLEPGHDSPKTNGVYKDLFALTLDYFSGDYASRNIDVMLPTNTGVPTRYDGTIQGAAWRTPASPDVRRVAYVYDEQSQLQSSTFAKLGISGGYYHVDPPKVANSFQEGGLTYDLNGNMQSLRRTDQNGQVSDNFSYVYKANTNQLSEVHTGSASGAKVLDYDYDELGQMTRQRDEQGQRYFSYDVTGKTTGVYLDAAHNQPLVTFAYDDRGFRVSKTAYAGGAATQTTYYVRDVAGNILTVYSKPTPAAALRRTEVPLYGASRLGALTHLDDGTANGVDDYRYELNDHLGDARVVFHQPTTTTWLATMELANQTREQQDFTYVASTRYVRSGVGYNSDAVARLGITSGQRVGPSRTLTVQQGDTITFSAYAYLTAAIVQPGGPHAAPALKVVPLLGAAALANGAGSAPAPPTPDAAPSPRPNLLARLGAGLGVLLNGKPAAPLPVAQTITGSSGSGYLHFVVRDEQGTILRDDYQELNGGAPGSWQPLQVGLRLAQGGTVALSVEADGALGPDVYFDNVRVAQSGGLIVQEQHQYAFGSPLPGLSYTVGNKRYRYGYQSQYAEHDDETGFESFELRLYNSRIGRWLSYDPEGQYSSPYVGMGNNPVSGVDPNGGWSGPVLDGAAFGAALGNVAITAKRGLSAWARAGLQAASSFARVLNSPSWEEQRTLDRQRKSYFKSNLETVQRLGPDSPYLHLSLSLNKAIAFSGDHQVIATPGLIMDFIGPSGNVKLIGTARQSLLNLAKDEKLIGQIKNLYIEAAQVGNGSAMDAYRLEKETGTLVGGRSHLQKIIEARNGLVDLLHRSIKRGGKVVGADKQIVKQLLTDIQDALK